MPVPGSTSPGTDREDREGEERRIKRYIEVSIRGGGGSREDRIPTCYFTGVHEKKVKKLLAEIREPRKKQRPFRRIWVQEKTLKVETCRGRWGRSSRAYSTRDRRGRTTPAVFKKETKRKKIEGSSRNRQIKGGMGVCKRSGSGVKGL